MHTTGFRKSKRQAFSAKASKAEGAGQSEILEHFESYRDFNKPFN
jgi:hypothetical protein